MMLTFHLFFFKVSPAVIYTDKNLSIWNKSFCLFGAKHSTYFLSLSTSN